jgi:hypothetical protein
MYRNLVLIIIGVWILVATCKVEACDRVKDYIFSVTGVVLAEDGTALQDAEVTLDVSNPVYDGVTLVKTARHTTNRSGGFGFMYTSHERGAKYKITIQKKGFETQVVSGSAPPAGEHTIRLKKVEQVAGSENVPCLKNLAGGAHDPNHWPWMTRQPKGGSRLWVSSSPLRPPVQFLTL